MPRWRSAAPRCSSSGRAISWTAASGSRAERVRIAVLASHEGTTLHHLSSRTHPDPDALDAAIAMTLIDSGAEIVVLAGYMRKIGPRTIRAFHGRILNTHPALLPKFGGQGMYGLHVHRRARGRRRRDGSVGALGGRR